MVDEIFKSPPASKMSSDQPPKEKAFALVDARAWGLARAAFQELAAKTPDDPHLWYGLYRAKAGLGDQDGGDDALKRAYALGPKDPLVASEIASRLLGDNAPQQAVQVVQRALARAPDDPRLLYVLGDAYESLDQKSGALKVCARLAHLLPSDVRPRLKAARILMRARDLTQEDIMWQVIGQN